MAAMDIMLAFPPLVLALALVTFLSPPGEQEINFPRIVTVLDDPRHPVARAHHPGQHAHVRAARVRHRGRARSAPATCRILTREILPNVLPPMASFALLAHRHRHRRRGRAELPRPVGRRAHGHVGQPDQRRAVTSLDDAPGSRSCPCAVMFLTVAVVQHGRRSPARVLRREGESRSDGRKVGRPPPPKPPPVAGTLLEVEEPPYPLPHRPRAGPSGRRRQLHARPGQDPRRRGRVGVGQDHPVPLDHGPAAHQQHRARGPGALRGQRHLRLRPRPDAEPVGHRDGHGVPGPDDLAQPGGRRSGGRSPSRSSTTWTWTRTRPRRRPLALLTSVGIPEPAQRLKEYPHQLSGGMRQRVVDRHRPGLRPPAAVRRRAHHRARRHRAGPDPRPAAASSSGSASWRMVLVTHDLGVVAGRADEIAVMYAGKIVEKAPTSVLFSNVRMPYTEALLKSIPRLENQPHTKLEVIAGRPPDLINPPKGCNFSPRCPYAQPRCFEDEPPAASRRLARPPVRLLVPGGLTGGQEGPGGEPRAGGGSRPGWRWPPAPGSPSAARMRPTDGG